MLDNQGPTGVFTSSMGAALTRFCDLEIITPNTTFSVLEFMFPTTETEEASSLVTYPVPLTLKYVKRFKVTAGAVLAHFYPPKIITNALLPNAVNNLIMWVEADSLTSLNDGDPVTTWTDQSIRGNNLGNNVAIEKPLLKTNIVGGLPVVRFDGVNDSLVLNGSSDFQNLVEATILIVRNNPTAAPAISIPQPTSVSQEYLMYDTRVFHNSSDGNFSLRTHHITPTGFYIQTARFGTAAANLENWINGIPSNDALSTTGMPANYIPIGRSIYVGVRFVGPGIYFAGDIAAIIIYSASINDGNRAGVEQYLADKYGIGV